MAERRSGINAPVPPEAASPVNASIYTIRGVAVMLDSDLADVYEVTTKALNQAVKRNERRFPFGYSFLLTETEWENLRSQFVTSRSEWGGRRYPPRAFTEHGVVMLAAILNSDRAIAASLAVVEAFVRLRRVLDANHALAKKIDELAGKVDTHDRAIAVIFRDLRQMAAGQPEPEPEKPKGRIGFRTNEEREAERRERQGRAKKKT